jgi:hypothetical protein
MTFWRYLHFGRFSQNFDHKTRALQRQKTEQLRINTLAGEQLIGVFFGKLYSIVLIRKVIRWATKPSRRVQEKKTQKTMSDLPFHIVWAVDTHLFKIRNGNVFFYFCTVHDSTLSNTAY